MRPVRVFIIGGGLSGLSAGIFLAQKGIQVQLMEKKAYPFHRVCGEYVSNEVIPFLKKLGINPLEWGTSQIEELEVSSAKGRTISQKLDLGGFGISRYTLDLILFNALKKAGAETIIGEKIVQVDYKSGEFILLDSIGREFYADYVIGAFGKRSNLDPVLNRSFFKQRSPFMGVKYHIRLDMPKNLIQLHNFEKGYAGISAIENNIFCLCYLSHNSHLKKYGSIVEMESSILKKNPFLKNIFDSAEFLWEKPLVINEISFSPKESIVNHILMSGDSAGLISPLCGNGMAMAIHSGKMVGETILEGGICDSVMERSYLEKKYALQWNKLFRNRLWVGRQIQNILGNSDLTHYTLGLLKTFPWITQTLIKNTHGTPF